MKFKNAHWIWGSALLLYAASLCSDDAALILVFYWVTGWAAAIGLCAWGLKKGLGLSGFFLRAESVWFGVMAGVGAYALGVWARAWLVTGAVRLPSVPWISGCLLALSLWRLRRGHRGLLAGVGALGIAGLALVPPLFLVGNAQGMSQAGSLRTFPYMAGREPGTPKEPALTVCDARRACPGMTLLVITGSPCQLLLLDLDGRLVQTWAPGQNHPLAWLGDPEEIVRFCSDPAYDQVVEAVRGLEAASGFAPHAMCMDAAGHVFVLVDRIFRNLRYFGLPVPVVGNDLVEFTAEGTCVRTMDLTPACKPWLPAGRVAEIVASLFSRRALWEMATHRGEEWLAFRRWKRTFFFRTDLLHADALTATKAAVPGVCASESVLVSPFRAGLAGIVNLEENRMVWRWRGNGGWGFHSPVWTRRGTIMMFENRWRGGRAGEVFSRILEVDPRTRETVWEYMGTPPEAFSSDWEGSCQPLPGGNVLIADSLRGRVFEVTREAAVVWEYRWPIDYEVPGLSPARSVCRAVRLRGDKPIQAVLDYIARKKAQEKQASAA